MPQFQQDDDLAPTPAGEPVWTEREKALFNGVSPDDLDQVAPKERSGLDSALDEAEDAARDQPLSRRRPPVVRRPSRSEEELEYADDLGNDEQNLADDTANQDDFDEFEEPQRRQPSGRQRSWIDQDILDMAGSYGLNEDGLRQFGSREEFERIIPILDAQASQYIAQVSPIAPQVPANPLQPFLPQPVQQQPTQQQPIAPEPQAQVPADKPGTKDGVIDVEFYTKLYKDKGFEDDTVEVMTQQLEMIRAEQLANKELRGMFAQQQESFQMQQAYLLKQEQDRAVEEFHDACDQINPRFFGMSMKDGRKAVIRDIELQRRRQVGAAIEGFIIPQILQQQQAAGQTPKIPSYKSLVARAQKIVFGREQALREQSSRRRPTGSGASRANLRRATNTHRDANQPITAESQIAELSNNPELMDAWNNGGY